MRERRQRQQAGQQEGKAQQSSCTQLSKFGPNSATHLLQDNSVEVSPSWLILPAMELALKTIQFFVEAT